MSFLINRITDLISTKVNVDEGPLEQKPGNSNRSSLQNQVSTESDSRTQTPCKFRSNLVGLDKMKSMKRTFIHGQETLNLKDFLVNSFFKSQFDKSEEVRCTDECVLKLEDSDYPGLLALTDYRLIYKYDKSVVKNHSKIFGNFPKDYFEIPVLMISKIEKNNEKKISNKYNIEIFTKDNRNLKLTILNSSKQLYGELAVMCNPTDISGFYQYSIKYREFHPVNEDGWKIYNFMSEFTRQGAIGGEQV